MLTTDLLTTCPVLALLGLAAVAVRERMRGAR